MALKIDAKFEGNLNRSFKNDTENLANFHRLKNSDLILESRMAELNQNNQKTSYTCSTESLFLRYKKNSKNSCENKGFSSMFSTFISRT